MTRPEIPPLVDGVSAFTHALSVRGVVGRCAADSAPGYRAADPVCRMVVVFVASLLSISLGRPSVTLAYKDQAPRTQLAVGRPRIRRARKTEAHE